MLELAPDDVGLPFELSRVVGELPLAASAVGEVGARRLDAARRGLLDGLETHPGPRALVEHDLAEHHFTRHGSGHEVRLPLHTGNGFAEVGHRGGGEADHAGTVALSPERQPPVGRLDTPFRSYMVDVSEAHSTPAIDFLETTSLSYRVTRTRRADSVEEAAQLRGVPVAAIIKSIVVRKAEDDYTFVLVPGDRAIDWGKLRRYLGVRRISLPDAQEAFAATGYERGAITPLGATNPWPVLADERLAALDVVSIGGGDHGVSVAIAASDLFDLIGAAVADVTKGV